jgi:hypothetical protein
LSRLAFVGYSERQVAVVSFDRYFTFMTRASRHRLSRTAARYLEIVECRRTAPATPATSQVPVDSPLLVPALQREARQERTCYALGPRLLLSHNARHNIEQNSGVGLPIVT